MRLSSVMFFSFSSAMVMFTCNKEGWEWGDLRGGSAPEKIRRDYKTLDAKRASMASPKKLSPGSKRRIKATALARKPPSNRCITSTIPLWGAVRRRGALQPARQQTLEPAPGTLDWWCESGPIPHWPCPAAGYSACAASVLPCSPVDRAGSDWTHERVPQIPNRNALRVSPSRVACPDGTAWRRRCSWGANTSKAAPQISVP
jgi:hypothetical protein